MKLIKSQSLDRIEVTYNKYFHNSQLIEKCTSKITEKDIIDFLQKTVATYGHLSKKEFDRIYQIVKGVMVYSRDIGYGNVRLLDWDSIKRHMPSDNILSEKKQEYALSTQDINRLLKLVTQQKIYHEKQSACLCLCMNFYLGLRIGELAALSFTDFDLNRNIVRITKTESKSYNRTEDGEKLGTMQYQTATDLKTANAVREIPILPEVRYLYEKVRQNHLENKYDSPYLVYDGADTIRVRSLDRTLRRLCKLCEIDYFNSHCIRKTFATMLHHNNVPTRVISDLMGHSEISTTENSYILSYADNYEKVRRYMQEALCYN